MSANSDKPLCYVCAGDYSTGYLRSVPVCYTCFVVHFPKSILDSAKKETPAKSKTSEDSKVSEAFDPGEFLELELDEREWDIQKTPKWPP